VEAAVHCIGLIYTRSMIYFIITFLHKTLLLLQAIFSFAEFIFLIEANTYLKLIEINHKGRLLVIVMASRFLSVSIHILDIPASRSSLLRAATNYIVSIRYELESFLRTGTAESPPYKRGRYNIIDG